MTIADLKNSDLPDDLEIFFVVRKNGKQNIYLSVDKASAFNDAGKNIIALESNFKTEESNYNSNMNIHFPCPHCKKIHVDRSKIYLNRCRVNKSGVTSMRCSCGYKFGITYKNGNAESFITYF